MTRHTLPQQDVQKAALRHRAGLKAARGRLLRDSLLYALLPVLAAWGIWLAMGGLPWPLIVTLIALAWLAATWSRFNQNFSKAPEAPQGEAAVASQVGEVAEVPVVAPLQEDLYEIPKVRFNDEGDLTDSFVRQLYRPPDDNEAAPDDNATT